ARAPIADIGPLTFVPPLLPLDHFGEDVAQVIEQLLASVRRHRRHHVHPLPDLVIQVQALPLPLFHESVHQSGLPNQQPRHHPSLRGLTRRCSQRPRRQPAPHLSQSAATRASPHDHCSYPETPAPERPPGPAPPQSPAVSPKAVALTIPSARPLPFPPPPGS